LGKAEEEAVVATLRSGWLGAGPQVAEFEKRMARLTGNRYAVALNSATAALHLSLLTTINPGDEVITPSLTFVAGSQAILLAEGKPVWADVQGDTFCTDPQDVVSKISKKTRAIIVMHYGGHPVDVKPILKRIRGKKIVLIEDCAHATGSYYHGKHVGGLSTLGCFSFAAIKNLTTGDGGMVVTNNKTLADKIRLLSWSGISSSTWKRYGKDRIAHKWEYEVKELGYKYQMNDLAASIGLQQFKQLKWHNSARKRVADRYYQSMDDIDWATALELKPFANSAHHNFVIRVDKKMRNRLIEYLNSQGIAANVHYYPNHLYPMFKEFKTKLPVTERVWQEMVLLPIFPDLTKKDQDKVIRALNNFPVRGGK
jgi:perosamine synthetase